MPHINWSDAYFGALYRESVRPLLTPALSRTEADAIATLLALTPRDRVLDLGCGHGRHGAVLRKSVRWVGLDRSAPYLAEAAVALPGSLLTRGDQLALPFGAGFNAIYSWYASLFIFDDATNLAALIEAVRCLLPGGRLLVHHANPSRLIDDADSGAGYRLPDGTLVEETSQFDPQTGVDHCHRKLTRPDGEVLEASAFLRYYSPVEWTALAAKAGLKISRICTNWIEPAEPARIDRDAPDLVVVAERA